jgi:hypothetical protein
MQRRTNHGKFLPQDRARIVCAFLYCREWNAQCAGYFRLAVATEVLERQYHTLTRRKALEGRAHGPRLISPLDVGLGAERIIRNHFRVRQRCPRRPEVSASHAIAVLGDNSSEPGNECGWLPQVSEMQVDVQKRLLGRFTRELNIAQPTHRECHREALKTHNKRSKRDVITTLSCADDLCEVATTGYARRAAHINGDPD